MSEPSSGCARVLCIKRARRRHVSQFLDARWPGVPGGVGKTRSEALEMSLSTAKRAQEHTIVMRRGIRACVDIPACLEWLHLSFHTKAARVQAHSLGKSANCQLIVWEPSTRRFALPDANLAASCRGASPHLPCPGLGGVLLPPVP